MPTVDFERLFAPFHPPRGTFVERLRYWAAETPSQTAFAFYSGDEQDETRLSFRQLDHEARAIAAELIARRLQGQRALLLYPPGLDFVAALFGCLYAGVIAVPAYPPRRSRNMERIEAISEDADAAVVLSTHDITNRPPVEHAPHLRRIPWIATDRLPADLADQWEQPPVAPESLAILQYTSGSTGAPKGVMLTQANLIHNCELITYGFEPGRNTTGLFWLPTYHDMGLVGGILEPLYLGRTSVLMPPLAFLQKPVRWLRGISRFRATISGGPNFAYALCNEKVTAEECAGLDLSSWEVAFNGAEPIRAETLEAFTQKFAPYGFRGHTHYPCYGMAETTLLVTGGAKRKPPVIRSFNAEALDDHRVVPMKNGKNGPHGAKKLVSSGRVLPGDELAIVDPETSLAVADDRVGEIWVSSPSVAQGYWNKPEETARVFGARLEGRPEAYLRTGDLGFLHDGELYVTGRCKDLIIIRGRNLYPHDVELTVEKCHPALRTAGGACFSVEVAGEERLVVVQELERQQAQADGQAIIAAIREAVLEEHEASLHSVCLLRAGKLPKTSSGKVQRRACREAYLQGALESQAQWTEDVVERRAEAVVTSAPADGDKSPAALGAWLAARVAAKLKRSAAEIDVHEPFARFGLDSLALVELSGELEKFTGRSVSPTVLYSYPTIAELAQHLAAPQSAQTALPSDGAQVAEPIAVVGLACRFPGAANPAAFWELLREGRDAIGEAPQGRWDIDRHYNPDQAAAGRIYTRHGGFIDGVDQFDPHFFGIAPREAVAIDPQQRLLLEVAWETLENGAIPPEKIAGGSLGIFVGISNGDYARLQNGSDLAHIDAYSGTGNAFSVAAGRLAYVLGVHGPCLAVDTACSSSLVAVHLAMQSLRKGECRAALAGGVNLMLDPSATAALCRLQALSPDGRCKTFDASADGYGRGEGCGLVLLKRLSDAIAGGDRIWAVLRGSAVNHDGRSNGLTAPHGPSQEALLIAALAEAQVKPAEVGYLEAHGTGTSLGDPIEVQAISAVLGKEREAGLPLVVGSVKTNIGHLESAAGISGLIKAILSLLHGEIPPHLHLETPNPYIPWADIAIQIPRERMPWPASQRRRIAGVSAFGFSGTNAHVIVEESPRPRPADAPSLERRGQLLVISAKDEAALRELAGRYVVLLQQPEADLDAICQTAALGRTHFAHRLAVMAENPGEAVTRLEQFLRGERPAGLFHGRASEHRLPKIACLFTGQGSQFAHMAHGLYQSHPTFKAELDRCDAILREHLPQPLLTLLFGSDDASSPIHQTRYTQPALFAVEYALCELWKSWGIEPTLALGHSIGEYVAACALGVLSLEDALRLVAARGRLMQELPAEGAMVAVTADEPRVRSLLATMNGQIDLAAVNSPVQTVISGPAEAIDRAAAACEGAGLRTSKLRVSHAFHSALMEPMQGEFERLCRQTTFNKPAGEIAANVYGKLVTDEIASPDYWRKQIRSTVRFADCLAALDARGVDVFLEIGPKPILTPAGRQTLPDRGQLWLASLRPGKDDWSQMLECVAELYVRGAPLDWAGFYKDQPGRRAALPNYPFQRSRYWIDAAAHATPATTAGRAAIVHESKSDSLFEIQWQPRSRLDQALARRAADYIPASQTLAAAVQPECNRLTAQLSLPRYVELLAALDRLSACYVWNALVQLGWTPSVGDQFSPGGLAERLGVSSKQRLLGRLLDMLAEDGILAADAGGWNIAQVPAASDPAHTMAELAKKYPECSAELTLVSSCAGNLAGVLRGEIDPLQLLFPGGSTDLVERLYRDSPFARSLNALLEETLSRAIADLPPGRSLKILEIGAGTGGTTAHLLPRLPADRTEYVFTDVSQVFMHEAAAKFRQYPFLRYAALDIESPPAGQGFAAGQFDVVIAANVLHATRDLRQSLAHVRELLAPAGALVLLEGTRPQRWLDLIFGLTEGWWRFADDGVREKHPLVGAGTWQRLLNEQGFADFAALPCADDSGQPAPPQAVLVARATPTGRASEGVTQSRSASEGSPEVSKWLILADQSGVGDALASALESAGHECAALHAERARDLPGLLESHAFDGIVHLWALDAAPAEELTPERLQEAQWLACESVIEVVQELVAESSESLPRLWFATRGAQAAQAGDALAGLAQSPLWGLARAIADEQPTLFGGLVDLDPEQSASAAAAALADELLARDVQDQVAYRADQRYAARLVRRPGTGHPHRPLRWRTDASYLITGGLGEIGLRVAEWMADQGAHHLVLVDRTEPSDRGEVLRRLEERGATIRVAAVDVTDEAAMRRLLDELVTGGWPPIRGVFHAAGQVAAGQVAAGQADAQPLTAIRTERLAQVIGPAMTGGWVLHKLLAAARLDFFVCSSSSAAILPPASASASAAASSFSVALAHYRRAAGLPALTILWGDWELAANSAPAALAQLIEQDATSAAVLPVDLREWLKDHPAASQSLLANLRLTEGLSDDQSVRSDEDGANSPRAALEAASPEARRQLAENYLRERISRVLRMAPEKLGADQSLNNLGIDSLMAVELRNHVQANLGVTIPLARLLQDPTIAQLAQVVLDQVGSATEPAAAPPHKPPAQAKGSAPALQPALPSPITRADSAEEPSPDVQDLSDEEVDALLRQMLSEEEQQA
jgi:acyl transferase domain-containing protein/acyl-CoA synthetase (AMP-forming)/AMP-acid ligase II/acyl carrier protein